MNDLELISLLLEDVEVAETRQAEADSPVNRRNLIRTVFATIDGLAWVFRQLVLDDLGELDLITADEELALIEASYSISQTGKISKQKKFVSAPAAIRLACRIVSRGDPTFSPDFGANGWSSFNTALTARNRITGNYILYFAGLRCKTIQDRPMLGNLFAWIKLR